MASRAEYLWNNKALLAALLVLTAGMPVAQAEDIDPFQIDSGRWMSYERYADYQKRGVKPNIIQTQPTYDTNAVENKDVAEPVDNQILPQATQPTATAGEKQSAQNTVPSGRGQVMAQPSRPLDLPELPGVNKGFSITVQSTSDAAGQQQASSAAVVTANGKTDLKLHDRNWQKADEAIQQVADNVDTEEDHHPVNVRPSFLPNTDVSPVTAPKHPSARSARIAQVIEQEKPKPTPVADKQPDAQAVCAAIDSYKKKQVEALQSDRQTLLALQSAIADLGLQKQLNFMTGAQGEVAR
ncbi:MAG: hypothetical protein JO126_03250 [Alphaproteobacteria bacterium]|nr:hypothetical protein [Alphaproteobacteria bacterium]MBV8548456.1 hypothetical protein [Alphaproteobacteria bacterium]